MRKRIGKLSAGLLMFRRQADGLEVFLVHPGGPFFRNKDEGAWTIPKGIIEDGELPLDAAIREFHEETSLLSSPPYLPLTPVRQKSGKVVMAWAFRGDADPYTVKANSFTLEWPPGSGRFRDYPEIDYAAFFTLDEARRKLNPAQVAFLDELERTLMATSTPRSSTPPPPTPARMAAVQAPVIPIVARWIRETPGAISLGQGIVSYGPPQASLDALRGFGVEADDHRYGPVEGLPALVACLEDKLRAENGIECAGASRVVVTAGGNMGFLNAVLAVTDPGDEVVLPVPFYFNHDMAIVMAGCRTTGVLTRDDYQLDFGALERAVTPRTRAIVTVSPNNPSGAMYPEAVLRELNAFCGARGLYHVHDEAYEYFTYGAPHVSPGSFAGAAAHTISLYSLSKAYGFASWRIGYMVAPEHLFDAINKIQDTNLICPPAVSQRAALAALRVGRQYAEPHVASLARVRALVRQRLSEIADLVDAPDAQGAFYVLLRVHTSLDAFALCERLIREHRVAAIPGSAFGLTSGCYLRISFGALAPETVAEGLDRLVTGLRAIVAVR